jgi:tRNA pseudouridine55 synthase
MPYPTDGILLIDKEEGESSHDVVRKLKVASKAIKVGHAGTLDPFATGLLVLLLGQGTKLSPFIMAEKKVYLANIRLGIETDTQDYTGRVIGECAVPELSPESIKEAAGGFVGDIEQTPPIYSAVKHNGVRAYKLARKGCEVVLEKRRVTIHSIEVLDARLPDVKIKVACSSGTYIRTLASDLGKDLGCGGHLTSLRRLASGLFEVHNSLGSSLIPAEGHLPPHFIGESLMQRVIPLRDALPGMRGIEVDPATAEKVRHGFYPALERISAGLNPADCDGTHFKLVSNDELVAVVKVNSMGRDGHGRLEIARVFC